MSFRYYKNVLVRHGDTSPMVVVCGDEIVEQNLNVSLPSSSDYSLKDLLAAGVPVVPVDPTVIHDSSATSVVADAVISNFVEPSKND